MSFLEFITFIFGMMFMGWMMFRRARELKQITPEELEELPQEERDQVKEYLKSLNIEMEETKPPPPAVPKHEPIVRRQQVIVQDQNYRLDAKPSRLKTMVSRLPSKKHLIIIREVLSHPKDF